MTDLNPSAVKRTITSKIERIAMRPTLSGGEIKITLSFLLALPKSPLYQLPPIDSKQFEGGHDLGQVGDQIFVEGFEVHEQGFLVTHFENKTLSERLNKDMALQGYSDDIYMTRGSHPTPHTSEKT